MMAFVVIVAIIIRVEIVQNWFDFDMFEIIVTPRFGFVIIIPAGKRSSRIAVCLVLDSGVRIEIVEWLDLDWFEIIVIPRIGVVITIKARKRSSRIAASPLLYLDFRVEIVENRMHFDGFKVIVIPRFGVVITIKARKRSSRIPIFLADFLGVYLGADLSVIVFVFFFVLIVLRSRWSRKRWRNGRTIR